MAYGGINEIYAPAVLHHVGRAIEDEGYEAFIYRNTGFYRTSICGRACDRACYIHLEEKGVLGKKFRTKFRVGDDWTLDTKQFETLKREKNWQFTKTEDI